MAGCYWWRQVAALPGPAGGTAPDLLPLSPTPLLLYTRHRLRPGVGGAQHRQHLQHRHPHQAGQLHITAIHRRGNFNVSCRSNLSSNSSYFFISSFVFDVGGTPSRHDGITSNFTFNWQAAEQELDILSILGVVRPADIQEEGEEMNVEEGSGVEESGVRVKRDVDNVTDTR